jgi:hypothetical protein
LQLGHILPAFGLGYSPAKHALSGVEGTQSSEIIFLDAFAALRENFLFETFRYVTPVFLKCQVDETARGSLWGDLER